MLCVPIFETRVAFLTCCSLDVLESHLSAVGNEGHGGIEQGRSHD
jgi:hypothetical protein